MSDADTTSMYVTIHDCPPHRVRAVLELLERYEVRDLEREDGPEERPQETRRLELGKQFGACGVECGAVKLLAVELAELAPEAAFSMYEQPAYEWIGWGCAHVPGLGMFGAHCGTDGEPLFTREQALEVCAMPEAEHPMAFGVRWEKAIEVMPRGVVVASEEAGR